MFEPNPRASVSRNTSIVAILLTLLSFTVLLANPLQQVFVARAGVPSSAELAAAETLVDQDFNGATAEVLAAGWYAENMLTPGVIDATLDSSGKEASAYHTPDIGGDRAFGYYKTSDRNSLQNSYIRFTYTPVFSISGLSGSFDFESSYTFWDASKPRQVGFSQDSVGTKAFTYSLNRGDQVEILDGASIGVIDNSDVTTNERRRWLSNAELDAFNLSIRGIQFSLDTSLEACDTLVLYWNSQEPINLYEDMQVNIDNFVLSGIPQSDPAPLVQVDDDWLGLDNCTVVSVDGSEYRVGVTAFAAIQDGVDAAALDGTVIVHPGIYAENLTVTQSITLIGQEMPQIDSSGGTAFACASSDNLVIKGFEILNSGTVFLTNACNLTAYANNIMNYTTPVQNNGGEADLGHNWWGSINPSGLSGTNSTHRLGAAVMNWADGANGDVSLDNASLDSSLDEGLVVIVNHGRGVNAAPFGIQSLSDGERLCSDYYDLFIVREGVDSYNVRITVDDTPECRTETGSALQKDGLYLLNRNSEAWERVPTTSHDNQSVYASLDANVLDGTPFVADAADRNVFLPLVTR